jgi:hypothetical protein
MSLEWGSIPNVKLANSRCDCSDRSRSPSVSSRIAPVGEGGRDEYVAFLVNLGASTKPAERAFTGRSLNIPVAESIVPRSPRPF